MRWLPRLWRLPGLRLPRLRRLPRLWWLRNRDRRLRNRLGNRCLRGLCRLRRLLPVLGCVPLVLSGTARIAALVLASCPGIASAGTTCDAVPKGPERTDCYLALSRSYQAQSDLAAAKARAQADAAWYRAITGEDPPRQQPPRRR